jgi:predicted dehydrogenase
MSAVAGSLGPRFRLLGLAGAFEKHGLDLQEAQLSAGVDLDDPGYGLEPPERWGVLARGETDRRPVETERGDYPRFYRGVAEAVRDGAPAPVSAADAVATLELLEAAATSAETGAVVPTAT